MRSAVLTAVLSEFIIERISIMPSTAAIAPAISIDAHEIIVARSYATALARLLPSAAKRSWISASLSAALSNANDGRAQLLDTQAARFIERAGLELRDDDCRVPCGMRRPSC